MADTSHPTASPDSRALGGKVYIVTGAASGIGAAVVRRLSEAGARVGLVDRNPDVLEVPQTLPADAVAVVADVADEADVDRYITACLDRWGRLDGIHLNAGYEGTPGPFVDSTLDDFDKLIATNVRGVYLGMRAATRHMIGQGAGGSIVVTVSVAGLSGSQAISLYSCSKHAALGLVRGAALDHARDGIRVNALCPGETDTPMLARALGGENTPAAADNRRRLAEVIPLGWIGSPDELAAGAVWLLSDDSSYVTGTTLVIDGGLTIGRFAGDKPRFAPMDHRSV